MRRLRNIAAAAAASGALLAGAAAHAQLIPAQPAPVQYVISPETPAPNQHVNIEVQGIGSFLGNSQITWEENGKNALSGIGEKSFSFTAGGIGTQTHIHLNIESSIQGVITHDFYFYPSTVSLIWEADTTVPHFYASKPLYSAGSRLRVIAFPMVVSGGTSVPSSKLGFQWSRNGNPDPHQSGLGDDSFVFDGDQIRSGEDVSVDVYYGTTKVGQAHMTIPASDPELIFYIQDPLRGELLDESVPNALSLPVKEVTLHAEPYFFSRESSAQGLLQYVWTLNGVDTTGPESAKGFLTLRQTGSGAGAARVDVSLQNGGAGQYIQSAKAGIQIFFGQTSSALSSFFGL